MRLSDRLLQREVRREARAEGARTPQRHPGAGSDATTCPVCGAAGEIDILDLREQEASMHCPSCESRWVTSRPA